MRLPRADAVFFTSAWALLLLAGSSRMFRDPGTFWHLLTGERILTKGFPHADWLTFTFQGKPWIAHQWLAECAMAILYRLGGYDALLVTASAATALLFTWLFRRLVARGVQVHWAVVLAALGLMTSAGSIHVRPALLSMVFFGWTFALLVDIEAGRNGLRRLIWLLPLFVVWVNGHGAVLGGLATLTLFAAHWIGSRMMRLLSPVKGGREVTAVALLVIFALLTTLVNPYGVEMIRTWWWIVRSPVVAEVIQEHGSLWRTGGWYVLPLALGYIAVLAGSGRERWSATSLLPVVWLVLSFQRVRHAPFFAVAALLAMAELLPKSRVAEWLSRHQVEVRSPCPPSLRGIGTLCAAPMLALGFTLVHFHATGRSLAGPERGHWPFALTPQIAAVARAAGPGAPVLNDMALGGFLAHEIPGILIFGDDRCELYGDGFLRDWYAGDPEWFEGWIRRHDVRIAVAEPGTPLFAYLRGSNQWREHGSTSSASLFIR